MVARQGDPSREYNAPPDVREKLEPEPGQKVQALPFKGRVELIPLFEVFRRIRLQRDLGAALHAVAHMQ